MVAHTRYYQFDLYSRRYRTQLRLARSVRSLFEALYDAISRTITCNDVGAHYVGIEMAPRDHAVLQEVLQEQKDQAVSSFNIGVVVESHHSEASQRWHQLSVQWTDNDKTLPVSSITPSPVKFHPETRRRVRWASDIGIKKPEKTISDMTAESVVHSSSPAGPPSTLQIPTSAVTDLCHLLQEGKDRSALLAPFGHFSTELGQLNLYGDHRQLENTNLVTLHTILDGHHADKISVELTYLKKIRLALALSHGVLHLYDTPWLGRGITSDDIVFLGQEQASGGRNYHLSRPLLVRAFTDPSARHQSSKGKEKSFRDLSIFSLGLLLTQIISGRHVPDLAIDLSGNLESISHKHEVAAGMQDLVLQNGGIMYGDAVQWCLNHIQTPDADQTRRDLIDRVIAALERSYKIVTRLDANMPSGIVEKMISMDKQSDILSAESAHLSQQQDDDTRTQYSTVEKLPLEKVDLFVSEFVEKIYTNTCRRYSQDTEKHVDVSWVERLNVILPEVLCSFAIQLGHDVNAQLEDSRNTRKRFAAMRLIHTNRK